MNDPRNGRPITVKELALVFKETYSKYAPQIRQHPVNWEALIKDVTTAINIPFVLSYDRRTGDMEMVAKTVMRKPNFQSPDPKLVVATKGESARKAALLQEAEIKVIPSNTKLWKEVFARATGATLWTLSNNFSGEPIVKNGHPDLDYIRTKLPAEVKANGKLVQVAPGKFRVRFHSNYWIELDAPGLGEAEIMHTVGTATCGHEAMDPSHDPVNKPDE